MICLAYQECSGAWSLDHPCGFSVLKYRSLQLTQCPRPTPSCRPRSLDPPEDGVRFQQSLPSPPHPRASLSQLSTNGCMYPSAPGNESARRRALLSACGLLDKRHRIYALKHREGCRWWRSAGCEARVPRRSPALGRMADGEASSRGRPFC